MLRLATVSALCFMSALLTQQASAAHIRVQTHVNGGNPFADAEKNRFNPFVVKLKEEDAAYLKRTIDSLNDALKDKKDQIEKDMLETQQLTYGTLQQFHESRVSALEETVTDAVTEQARHTDASVSIESCCSQMSDKQQRIISRELRQDEEDAHTKLLAFAESDTMKGFAKEKADADEAERNKNSGYDKFEKIEALECGSYSGAVGKFSQGSSLGVKLDIHV